MIYFIFHVIFIFCTVAAVPHDSQAVNSVSVIVKDLVENWESPVDYLKKSGYLPKDVQSEPDLKGLEQQLEANSGQELSLKKNLKRELTKQVMEIDPRAVRTPKESKDLDLKNSQQNMFCSKNETGSKKLNADVNVLKLAARKDLKNQVAVTADEPLDHTEPTFKTPQVKETLLKEPLLKEPLVKEPLLKEPLVKKPLFKEPLVKEPLLKEPLVKEPLLKEPLLKERQLQKPLAKEPLSEAKEPLTYDKQDYLIGLSKVLAYMQRKNLENGGKNA